MSCLNRHLHSHSEGRTLLISRMEEFTLVLLYLIQVDGDVVIAKTALHLLSSRTNGRSRKQI